MAIGALRTANGTAEGASTYVPVGVRGSIVIVHDDATATVATATELLQPFSYAGSNGHWVKRGKGIGRAYFFARQNVAAVGTTDPIIRIYGAYPVSSAPTMPDNNSGAIPNDGTWVYQRLDNADNNAAGLTLDIVNSGTGLRADSNYAWSDETFEIDLQDCWYFTILCSTAAVASVGAVPIYARVIS